MRTAEQLASPFRSMSDDLAAAMLANRSKFVDRAFKAVEHVTVTSGNHLKTERVIVAADFTFRHGSKTVPGGRQLQPDC
jgi:hypothetical protein